MVGERTEMTSAGGSSESEMDVAVDAIVYDVHPALAPRGSFDADYPYGPQGWSAARFNPSREARVGLSGHVFDAADAIAQVFGRYYAIVQSRPDFAVPKTFGMSAIFGIMTALAILFGGLRRLDAEPVFYFFFSVEAITICVAQMLYGKAPRVASILAGAIVLPAFTLVAASVGGIHDAGVLCLMIGFIPFGAGLGYLTGTCAAGIFLVMDYLESYLQGRAAAWPHLRRTTISS